VHSTPVWNEFCLWAKAKARWRREPSNHSPSFYTCQLYIGLVIVVIIVAVALKQSEGNKEHWYLALPNNVGRTMGLSDLSVLSFLPPIPNFINVESYEYS
jgi:hypothetical protein